MELANQIGMARIEKRHRQMSDYILPPRLERDALFFDPDVEDESGNGVTLVLGVVVAIALAVSTINLMGSQAGDRMEQAQLSTTSAINP